MEMSLSEAGLLTNMSPELWSMHINPTVYRPVGVSGAANAHEDSEGGANAGKAARKKRGRPRKYGSSMGLPFSSPLPEPTAPLPASVDLQFSPVEEPETVRYVPSATTAMRKGRGGGGAAPRRKNQRKQPNKNIGAGAGAAAGAGAGAGAGAAGGVAAEAGAAEEAGAGSTGIGITAHVITVNKGEDVASRIMSFSQQGARAVCILSATGGISNVTLRQPAKSGGTVTYEGRYEILSLSGSFRLTEIAGHRSRIGGLSITVAGIDGSVFGGGVSGLLTAATPVQVVLASFISEESQESRLNHQMEPFAGIQDFVSGIGLKRPRSPPGTPSDTSAGAGSPMNQQSNKSPLRGIPWK